MISRVLTFSQRRPAGLITTGLLLAGQLCVIPQAHANEDELAEEASLSGVSILDRSPFIPPGWTPPRQASKAAQQRERPSAYEFRGMYSLRGEYRFLVSEARSRSGSWVSVGEVNDDFEVRAFDADEETLTLLINNREQTLNLADLEANPTPMPVSGQPSVAEMKREENKPVARRTVRPSGPTRSKSSPPPPAWLQRLREEAAERRAEARGAGSVLPPSNINASSGPDFTPGPPPTTAPPTPPPNLTGADLPPPPSQPPPPPPPEILEKMREAWSRPRPGS